MNPPTLTITSFDHTNFIALYSPPFSLCSYLIHMTMFIMRVFQIILHYLPYLNIIVYNNNMKNKQTAEV
jgi:hypothetical protein